MSLNMTHEYPTVNREEAIAEALDLNRLVSELTSTRTVTSERAVDLVGLLPANTVDRYLMECRRNRKMAAEAHAQIVAELQEGDRT